MDENTAQMYLYADKLATVWFSAMSHRAPGRIREKSDIADKIRDLYVEKGFDHALFRSENLGALYTVVFKHLAFSKDPLHHAVLFGSKANKSDSDQIDYLAFKNGNFDLDEDLDNGAHDSAAEKYRKAEALKYAVREDELRTDYVIEVSEEPSDDRFEDYCAQLRLAQGDQMAKVAGGAFGLTDRSGRSMVRTTRRAMYDKIFAKAAKSVGMTPDDLNKLKKQYLKAA